MDESTEWILDDKGRPRQTYGLCKRCEQKKPYTEFSYSRNPQSGFHHGLCKGCDNDRERKRPAPRTQPGEPAWVARLEAKMDRLLKALGEE